MRFIKRNSGQFIPISAMVMFTMVVFMVAVVNIYKVSRAKLKVQNLADAAALNLAAQQAQAYNMMASRNEWMNHMVAGAPSPSDTGSCAGFNMKNPTVIPGIGCVENTATGSDMRNRHVFPSRWGAINYALLVRTVNVAQKLFLEAYNKFLGAEPSGVGSSSINAGPNSYIALLRQDIPELKKASLVIWNTGRGPGDDPKAVFANASEGSVDNDGMRPLKAVVDHDIQTRYQAERMPIQRVRFSDLLFGRTSYGPADRRAGPLNPQDREAVGWMRVEPEGPIMVNTSAGKKSRTGVGAYVMQTINIPFLGSKQIFARATAYLVEKSGNNGGGGGNAPPTFKPTYWVKLAN